MGISKRAQAVNPSITLAITAKAKQMKADGHDVIGFGAGEPDFDTPDFIKETAIEAINKGVTKYTPASGTMELKKTVAEKLKRENNLDYDASQISINCGAKHSLYNIFQAILDDGDEVIIPAPYWVSYPEMVTLAGGKSVFVECKEENNFTIDPEDLKKAISPKTKAFVLNSPSNPTGAVYTKEQIANVAKVLEDQDLYVISDEIYEKLLYDGNKFNSIANTSAKIKEKTIVVNGMSKAFSMTGWRIGYIAGPADVIKAINSIQSHSTSNPTSFCQAASVIALNSDMKFLDNMISAFDERRRYMVDSLNRIEGISCIKPGGAFYVFANISQLIGKKYNGSVIKDSVSFAEILLENSQVAAVPGIGFGADGYVRLSYAISLENIKKGLDRIKLFVDTLK